MEEEMINNSTQKVRSKQSVGETRGRAALMRIKSLKEATEDELE